MSDASLNRLPALSPRAARNAEAVLNASLSGPSFVVGHGIVLSVAALGSLAGLVSIILGVSGLILGLLPFAGIALAAGAFLCAVGIPVTLRQVAILRVALAK